jgi:Mrp family chromosome partitioning ATPase
MSRIYDAIRQQQRTDVGPRDWHGSRAGRLENTTMAETEELDARDVLTGRASKGDHKNGDAASELSLRVAASARNISPASVPLIKPTPSEAGRLVFREDADGLAAEQFRFLRRTLNRDFPMGAKLLITSASPQDGKTFSTLNLCSCLAESEKSTLLVEADVRQPSVSRVLGVHPGTPGIEHALISKTEPLKSLRYVKDLSFFAGLVAHPPADPSQVISGVGVTDFLDWAVEHFDWVVLDAPPIMPAADVMELVPHVDAVLLVVRAHHTPREMVDRACELLGDNLYGVIFNEATVQATPYYRYLNDYNRRYFRPAERKSESE